jgi:hypothetical protein
VSKAATFLVSNKMPVADEVGAVADDWQTNYQKTKGLLAWQQSQSGALLGRSFVDFGGSRAMEP